MMLSTTDKNKNAKCSLNITPQSANKALSKMKMPKIPSIAMDALAILKNTK